VVPRPGEYRGLDSYPPDLWARKAQGVHRRTAYDDTKHVFAVACVLRLNGALAWPQAVSRMGPGGWLEVDRPTSRINPLPSPDFDLTRACPPDIVNCRVSHAAMVLAGSLRRHRSQVEVSALS